MAYKRETLTFLGRTLGTHSGWDGDPGDIWCVYDFEPNPGINLSACKTLVINEGLGNFIYEDGEGNPIGDPLDIITTLSTVPKD